MLPSDHGERQPAATWTQECGLSLELISAHMLPKAGEQRCVTAAHDRYCAPSRVGCSSAQSKESGTTAPYVVIEVHGGGRLGCVVSLEADGAAGVYNGM